MLVAVATIIVKVTSDSIADKSGLPFIMQTMSWTVLGMSDSTTARQFLSFIVFLCILLAVNIRRTSVGHFCR